MSRKFFDDPSTTLATAIVDGTRPVTFDVADVLNLDGTELSPDFDIRIENELLKVTAVVLDGGGAGIDRWTAAHLGGAAASAHASGKSVDVVLTANGLTIGLLDYFVSNPTTTTGDMIYSNPGSTLVRLPIGTAGQVLTVVGGLPAWAAAAGGGSAVTTGTVGAVIPGLAGSGDIKAGGGSDDEFDQNTAGVPAGWTHYGTASVIENTNDFRSYYHLKQASQGSASFIGIYKAAPATPFTVTMKVTAMLTSVNFPGFGLLISESSPPVKSVVLRIFMQNTGVISARVDALTNLTTVGSSGTAVTLAQMPLYLRIKANSATSFDVSVSTDGQSWLLVQAGFNPSLASVTSVGPALDAEGQIVDAMYDWIRFS